MILKAPIVTIGIVIAIALGINLALYKHSNTTTSTTITPTIIEKPISIPSGEGQPHKVVISPKATPRRVACSTDMERICPEAYRDQNITAMQFCYNKYHNQFSKQCIGK